MSEELLNMTILDLDRGERFKVLKVSIPGEIGKRLADMGFTCGVEGKVVRSALFGDPIQIHIMGYNISIRKSEALGVEVESLGFCCGGGGGRHRRRRMGRGHDE